MINILIGLVTGFLMLFLFWNVGTLVVYKDNSHLPTSDRIGIGFVFTFIISIILLAAYALGYFVLSFL